MAVKTEPGLQTRVASYNKKHRSWERCFCSLSKNLFFDRLAEVKEAAKTSKPGSSAYIGTVEAGLRSKSKLLAQQAFFGILYRGIHYLPAILKKKEKPQSPKLRFDGLRLF